MSDDMFEATAADGSTITGFNGSYVHVHETGFSNGFITFRKAGEGVEHTPFDNSVRDVNELLASNPNFPTLE